mmetsp:Transcript_40349/g.86647  ORF Transcript_40349/g.86647 Transcript_40349/m.86647 type:complete len:204 (-) Transcript_40349:118-729(-)
MAKSKNHTAHNQSHKNHRNGIKKSRRPRKMSMEGMNKKFVRNQLPRHPLRRRRNRPSNLLLRLRRRRRQQNWPRPRLRRPRQQLRLPNRHFRQRQSTRLQFHRNDPTRVQSRSHHHPPQGRPHQTQQQLHHRHMSTTKAFAKKGLRCSPEEKEKRLSQQKEAQKKMEEKKAHEKAQRLKELQEEKERAALKKAKSKKEVKDDE